jgi:hypothetical protein
MGVTFNDFEESSLARADAVAWRYGWTVNKSHSLGLARGLANKAVKLAPEDARCEADLSFAKFWANEPADSAWHYERSIDTLPYHPELSVDFSVSRWVSMQPFTDDEDRTDFEETLLLAGLPP